VTVTVNDGSTTSPCYDAVPQRIVAGTNLEEGVVVDPQGFTPEIPALSGWGAAALGSLLSLFGWRRLRRRSST
jgi:hypothetical protein